MIILIISIDNHNSNIDTNNIHILILTSPNRMGPLRAKRGAAVGGGFVCAWQGASPSVKSSASRS